MKTLRVAFLGLVIVLCCLSMTATAEESARIFSLPDGVVGKQYRTGLAAVLSDKYGMQLDSNNAMSTFRWAFVSGEIPPGLMLRPNGTILGVPRVPRETPYQFKLKVSDAAVPLMSGLAITFDLTVGPSRVRLVPVSAVKLVPKNNSGDLVENENTNAGNAPIRKYAYPFVAATSAINTKSALLSLTVPSYPETSFSNHAKSISVDSASDGVGTKINSEIVSPKPATDCTARCNPTPTPDDKNDFIIDAASGTTKGRTRFEKRDRARIFIINKNPFLYDYRITLENKAVPELALEAFRKLLGPIGEGTFDAPPQAKEAAEKKRADIERATKAKSIVPCQELTTLLALEKELGGDRTNQAQGLLAKLRSDLKSLTGNFNDTNTKYKSAQKILTSSSVRCPTLCQTAGDLHSNLATYRTSSRSAVESYEKVLSDFREKARSLKTMADFVAKSNPNCAVEVIDSRLLELGDYYIEAGAKLKATFDELVNGRKVLADIENDINEILSSEVAFQSVYEKGDFDGPTDVLIKIERKSKVKSEGENNNKASDEFAMLVDTKLNFGGGPRFALAAGFAFSTLEKPAFQRVPAVINGQTEHIVGLKENSNTRFQPILMFHSRLFSRPQWKYVSGVHFSLGLTAKPDNEGTDAEFMVGPSVSFIEERLFFTFGGYAGRKQELEGNLTLGQKLPEGFGDELPISKHYVWKPGFAITYRIK